MLLRKCCSGNVNRCCNNFDQKNIFIKICRENGLIRKIRLISKFITSQPGQQIVAIDILSNILRIKSNQIMKLAQLIKYNKGNIFLQKLCRKRTKVTSSRFSFIFKKCLI